MEGRVQLSHPDNTTPKVTILITTFNLEKYINQAIDSLLMQETTFPYRILIADDCSTDRTQSIIANYEEKYPEIITVLRNQKNIGSLANSNNAFEHCKSEYFSFLDGDDYWLNKDRLEKQVSFLDHNPEFTMCAGKVYQLKDGHLHGSDSLLERDTFSFEDLVSNRCPFIHTSSILYRNIVFNSGVPDIFKKAVGSFAECAYRGEDARFALHLRAGKLKLFPDAFSVYRIHSAGLWQGSTTLRRSLESAITAHEFATNFLPEARAKYSNACIENFENSTILIKRLLFLNPDNLKEKDLYLYTQLLYAIKKSGLLHLQTKRGTFGIKRKLAKLVYDHLERKLFKD